MLKGFFAAFLHCKDAKVAGLRNDSGSAHQFSPPEAQEASGSMLSNIHRPEVYMGKRGCIPERVSQRR